MGELVDNLGGRTEDLLTLQQPLPAERDMPEDETEARMRRFGSRMLAGGLALGVLAALVALGTAVGTHTGSWGDELSDLISASAAMMAVGGMERTNRPGRAVVRLAIRSARENSEEIAGIAQAVNALANTIPTRLYGVERRLDDVERAVTARPDYSQGLLDGVQMRANVLGDDL